MKRRSKLAKALAVRRESKEAGMTCPGGKSRYAKKRSGQITPGPAQTRPSWFVRHGVQAAIDAAELHEREMKQRREAEWHRAHPPVLPAKPQRRRAA